MSHQNPEALRAGAPNNRAREQHLSASPEPRSYAAADVYDAILAPPDEGGMADYAAEGEAAGSSDQQQGRTRTGDWRVLRAGAAD